MRIEFHCRECGEHIDSEDQFRGEVIRCPSCQAEIVVPLTTVGPGAVVAGFRIVRKIGTGGMSSVYLAEQTSMGRQVALKVLPPAYTRDQVFLERFMKEIRLQGSLSHPNIATAFDAGKFHDIYYLAMEFVEGKDLCDLIAEQKQVDEKTALRIIRKAAAGLAHAWHRQNLIHRDVKPGNIMIAHGEEVKILDLGVSKTLTRSGDTQYSTDEAVIGTPHYMSPEQARESSSVDLRSDIYSLGATLYHLVTGQPPFPGENLVEVVTKQVSGPAPAPRELNPHVSAACAHLLAVMMAREVSERYENWDDCIADIGRVLSGQFPLEPYPAGGSMIEGAPSKKDADRTSRPEKERTAMPLVAMLTLLLGAALVWNVVTNRPRTPDPDPISTPPATGMPAPAPPDDDPAERTALEEKVAALDQRARDGEAGGLQPAYRDVANEALRLGYIDVANQIHDRVAEFRHQRSSARRTLLDELEEKAKPLRERGEYLAAAQVFRGYQGPGATATARLRLARASALEAQARQHAESHWLGFQDRMISSIIDTASLDPALALLAEARRTPALEPVRIQIESCEHELLQASRAPDDVMASFADDVGQEVAVLLNRGPKRLTIAETGRRSVSGTQTLAHGSLTYTFSYHDLSLQEKVSRLARGQTPSGQFMLGLLALEAGENSHAVASFQRADGPVSRALAERLSTSPQTPDTSTP